MALFQILQKVAAKTGQSDYASSSAKRARLVDVINEAAEELWESEDLPGSLQEVVLKVFPNSELALPYFIGELRAARSRNLKYRYTIKDLFPHYTNQPADFEWKEWRFKGYSATQRAIENAAPIQFDMSVADGSIITVEGKTEDSNSTVDTIIMDATSKVGTKSFSSIRAITRKSAGTYDINITDANGNELAVLYNNQLETRYIIVDVSQYPNYIECEDGSIGVEVLFKVPLFRLNADGDSFPIPSWDTLIANKAVQLFTEAKPGFEQVAAAMDAKIMRSQERKKRAQEGGISRSILFQPNPIYSMFDCMDGYDSEL